MIDEGFFHGPKSTLHARHLSLSGVALACIRTSYSVTDIIVTDPADPRACVSSMDIIVDQNKVRTLFYLSNESAEDKFTRGCTGCWSSAGLMQVPRLVLP